jgi:hypothetical protein
MALIGEVVVEEWLNRKGFFTIRGIKLGVQEIDILAVKLNQNGTHDCRHIEVQISTNPISYISNVPKNAQTASTKANSAKKRTMSELRQGVSEWIEKKFDHPDKRALKNKLCAESWTRELVVHKVRHQEELEILSEAGVNVIRLEAVLGELKQTIGPISGASGKEVLELMMLLDELKH